MWPVLFEGDHWRLRSYDVVLLIAIMTGFYLVIKGGVRKGFPRAGLIWLVAGTVIFALIGARINGWFFWFSHDEAKLNLDITSTQHGMTAFGGIAGAFLFAVPFAWLYRWNAWRLLDVVAPALVLCEGIQRMGCLLNGCCYGKAVDGFPGMYAPDILGIWDNRFPSQIATGLFCVVLFLYLTRYDKFTHPNGELFLQYLILYPAGRLCLDFMRADEPQAMGILSAHQVASIIMLLLAALIIAWRARNTPGIKKGKQNAIT